MLDQPHLSTVTPASSVPSLLRLAGKTLVFTTIILFFLITTTLGLLGMLAAHRLYNFSQVAGVSLGELKNTMITGWQTTATQTDSQKNILILGIDSLPKRGDVPPLTDTIIFASLNFQTGQVTFISLPRDLWDQQYQTKINALYAYGSQHYPDQPQRLPQEVISRLTGQPIHQVVVISLEGLGALIDVMGGVEVSIPETFTDTQFPRPDVDIAVETDPAKLYQTVTFTRGLEQMSSERALQYIRSRKSSGEQGTDLARGQRQQQVIMAVIAKLRSSSVLLDPQIMGQLYRLYQDQFAEYLALTELIATFRQLLPVRNQLQLDTTSLPVYPEDSKGAIYHPPVSQTRGQWVYQLRDPNSEDLQTTFAQLLKVQ